MRRITHGLYGGSMTDETIELYFDTLAEKYGNEVRLAAPDSNEAILERIPAALGNLYRYTSKVNLPFGEIYPVEKAVRQSEKNPFSPDWCVFGKDKYFSFWLCSYSPNEEGSSFTYWDHESGNEIEEALWSDLVSFLTEMDDEYGR